MDEDGYICLTDFGLAKVLEGNAQALSFCGTPDYLAPEILVERGHSFPVDWWALGILTYEMIVGFPPFYTGTQNNSKMYELIKKKAVYFPDPQRHNIMMSENCKNFITRVSNRTAFRSLTHTLSVCLSSCSRKTQPIVSDHAVVSKKCLHTRGSPNSTTRKSWNDESRRP